MHYANAAARAVSRNKMSQGARGFPPCTVKSTSTLRVVVPVDRAGFDFGFQ